MRRLALLASVMAALAILTACSSSDEARYDPNKTLTVTSPDLVAIKKHSDIPNCPRVAADGTDGGMPRVTLSCLGGGRPVDMEGLRGPMIVNFWASWCGSCRDEMPALAAYAKSQSAVKILGIDFLDPHPDAALDLAKNSSVAYPLVTDPKGALDTAGALPHISAMPMTVFLDADGTIAHIEAKAYTSEQDVAAAARQYLGAGG
jgi:cytochrome c biogenesis protein CcmG/thiol:disulfide interchange protein DsbE